MSYKTLIIIDNSNELTTYNMDLIRSTVKYFISTLEDENKVAIALTGEKAEYVTDYEDSNIAQLKAVDEMQFYDVTAPGIEVLMDVISRWKESDLASRDIIYVGGKSISTGSDYSLEELLFEINGKQYPIYSLACIQNENDAFIKNMGSICRISGGTLINMDDVESDAEVEKQLVEKLRKAMEYKRSELDEFYEDLESQNDSDEESVESIENIDEYEDIEVIDEDVYEETYLMDENGAANVIYEQPNSDSITDNIGSLSKPFIMIISIFLIVIIMVSIRNNKYKREEDRFRKNLRKDENDLPKKRIPFEDSIQKTTCLSKENESVDTGTKLLYQTKEGIEITLEDRANPTKYFRACIRDSFVIGRNDKLCDLTINYDDSVSSRHCELFVRDNELYCRDLDSSNGTMINQQKVYQEIRIESGDILRIGRLSFFIQIVGEGYE